MNTMAGEYLAMKDSLTHHTTLMENVQVKISSTSFKNLLYKAGPFFNDK